MSAKLPRGTLEKLWSDPTHWHGGIYRCAEDPRAIVPKRIKALGWTINFARPSAWWGLIVGITATVVVAVGLAQFQHGFWLIPGIIADSVMGSAFAILMSSAQRYEEEPPPQVNNLK